MCVTLIPVCDIWSLMHCAQVIDAFAQYYWVVFATMIAYHWNGCTTSLGWTWGCVPYVDNVRSSKLEKPVKGGIESMACSGDVPHNLHEQNGEPLSQKAPCLVIQHSWPAHSPPLASWAAAVGVVRRWQTPPSGCARGAVG